MEIEIINWEKYNPRRDLKNPVWFRFQSDFLESPTAFELSNDGLIVWLLLLCRTSKAGGGPVKVTAPYLAKHARCTEADVVLALEILEENDCIKVTSKDPNQLSMFPTAPRALHNETVHNETRRDETNEKSSAEAPPRRPGRHTPNPLNIKIWENYCEAYKRRYGTEPVRNLTVNSQIAALGKRLGEEAIEVVQFYVMHNQQFYVRSCHPIGLCLKDAEALRTQWARGRAVMSTEATSVDKTQSNANSWDYAAKVLAAEKEKIK